LAQINVFRHISLAHESAFVANVNLVCIRLIKQTLFEEIGRTVSDDAIALHLSKPKTTASAPSHCGLPSETLSFLFVASKNFVVNQMLQTLIVSRAEKDSDGHAATGVPVVHDLIP
jgi:hypothetical protein